MTDKKSSTDVENGTKEELYSFLPAKAFFSLKEVCSLKGLNYKSACNKPYLQSNGGKADGRIAGKKSFHRQTVIQWLFLTDEGIISNAGGYND
ncbi:MAG: hypothetical protein PF693_00735 [Spirochaetia bacterium]|jgi:predicted transcriptional regulator|nr:hypothetical protein [Spirochaetia bacterium]